MPSCGICAAPNVREVETVGLQALAEKISWREASRQTGHNHTSLKNHMQQHYVDQTQADYDDYISEELLKYAQRAMEGLRGHFEEVPDDAKPMVVVAMHNLKDLHKTPSSQKNLTEALKTIQQMTGMKSEQRGLLLFAQAMKAKNIPELLPIIEVEALEAGDSDDV